MRTLSILMLFLTFAGFRANGQKITRIELVGADLMTAARGKSSDATRLVGNVKFRHESSLLSCDSAFLMSESNSLEAFGNVVINNNDSVFVYGERLFYDGNTRNAQMFDKVSMVDNQMVLTTNNLTYNVKDNIGSYYSGGKIVDTKNVLTSKYGYYYANQKEFFFKKDVVLTNPEYVMISDTLMYNTETEIAYFYGPTRIEATENLIYCENGWYNTRTDISQYNRNAYMQKAESILRGDSLYYDRANGIGRAFRNVSMIDTVQNVIIRGHTAEYLERQGVLTITDSSLAIIVEKSDSLFLHGDTLVLILDSLNEGERLHAFFGVKFFRHDMQGACDSMVYGFKDSLVSLYYDPVLWNEKNQLSATLITIKMGDGEVKELLLHDWGFIIEENDTLQYNQVKGKSITAFFSGGNLYRAHVVGSAESIYYVMEDDGSLLGINKGQSTEMNIYVQDNEIETITFITDPTQTLYPPKEFPEKDSQLKGFSWQVSSRPLKMEDIFHRRIPKSSSSE